MKKSLYILASLALVAVMLPLAPALGGDDDSGNELSFKANNSIYNAEGKFHKWEFTKVEIPDGNLEKGTVEIEVELASVWEKAADLAAHLRNADFFDVDKFPAAKISISGAESTGEDTYRATATVSLHGNSGEVPVDFKVLSRDPLSIEGTAVLDRTLFGVGKPFDGSKYSVINNVEIGLKATLP